MTTVAILPIADADGRTTYRAVADNKHSSGQTAGQALDALIAQFGDSEFRGLLVIQSFRPDNFFSAQQQERLAELMVQWREARDRGCTFPPDQQAELDRLVEAELQAATARTATLLSTDEA